MDRLGFEKAKENVLNGGRLIKGIGTLGEKSLHAVLKEYYEPDEESREVRIGRFVADIVGEDGVIEIQTGSLLPLREKLGELLKSCRVTVVHPVEAVKYILYLDPITGEMTERRRSPRVMKPCDGLAELYRIKQFLNDERLRICFPVIETEQLRELNINSKEPKKGAKKLDKLPVRLIDEIVIERPEDYRVFLPSDLPEQFSSKVFAKACRIRQGKASTCLNVLTHVGAVRRVGKEGRSYIYERS
ncbi:MAG: hypothetical protein IJ737_00310 [Ruminococcus sp.]|nr:hypothetical protein [Ruminococcus sp.]